MTLLPKIPILFDCGGLANVYFTRIDVNKGLCVVIYGNKPVWLLIWEVY
jgi:hypothetical protein